ncbi:PP2C family protein-serine/threonine phosphatase, partial [Pseudomonadota bacterium]
FSRTQDHTTSGQIYLDGVISEEALATSEMQGHLVQAVGGPKRPIVTLGQELKLNNNESILLCSDGVWKGVKSGRLPKYTSRINLDDGVDELLSQAEKNQKSDCDNISTIIFRWEGPETNDPPIYPRGLPQIDQKKLWRDTMRLSREHRTVSEKDEKSHKESKRGKKHDDLELAIEELESFIEQIDRTL